MDQALDRPEARACAKWTLGVVTRACGMGLLLAVGIMVAALASLLTIDLPLPVGRDGTAGSFVPASDRWIELGTTSRTEMPPAGARQSNLPQRIAAVDPVPVPSRRETQTRPPRKPRGAPSNPRTAGAQKHEGAGRFATDTGARRT